MSLTSYRAAPPRVTSVLREQNRVFISAFCVSKIASEYACANPKDLSLFSANPYWDLSRLRHRFAVMLSA
jgi:hypothetical protein